MLTALSQTIWMFFDNSDCHYLIWNFQICVLTWWNYNNYIPQYYDNDKIYNMKETDLDQLYSILLYIIAMHYDDVIMGAIAFLITSLTIVYSTVYSDTDQRKHQSSASPAFAWGIHRGPVNSPHKWPVTQKMFPFDDVIMDSRPHQFTIVVPGYNRICWRHDTRFLNYYPLWGVILLPFDISCFVILKLLNKQSNC